MYTINKLNVQPSFLSLCKKLNGAHNFGYSINTFTYRKRLISTIGMLVKETYIEILH